MSTYCARRHVLLLCRSVPFTFLRGTTYLLQSRLSSSTGTNHTNEDLTGILMNLCTSRYFVVPGENHFASLLRGKSCGYGPLGTDLKRNIVEQWWISVMRSRAEVFGISTLQSASAKGTTKLIDTNALEHILSQKEGSKEQVIQRLRQLLKHSTTVQTSLLQGALDYYVPSLELVNRKLPFGLAEIGMCYAGPQKPSDDTGWSSEVTQSSLVWLCSPRTSSQWLDYWSRQRLQWWRKFAVGPSDFSCCDVAEGELEDGASRGVQVMYRFPWGTEALETLWSLGDTKLLKNHNGAQTKLQCRDGRKSVIPHVLWISGNMDRGVLAYLFDSLQLMTKVDNKQKLHQRKVLKLHPTLAPVKVALDMGRGSTMELRQLCEGLLKEFLAEGISTWPGYMETMLSSLDHLHTKYNEMGVLFTIMVSESTLENGLLIVRSRDTTIRETMHISEVKKFLLRYVAAAENT